MGGLDPFVHEATFWGHGGHSKKVTQGRGSEG